MSNIPRGPFMQAMEKYTKSLKAFISAQGFGHYSKPNGGIPKTDLDQSVQTSLGKADTALQTFTESDPTVPAWAKASSKPSYTASEVGLGKVGNFKAVSTEASQGLSDTEKVNARTNIGAGTSSFSGSYNDLSDKPTIPTKVSQLTNDSGYTANTGTVTGVKVGSTSYSPSSGVVSLPAYPTTLPASDVSSWAKASTKPSYTASEVGLGNVGNFKAVSTVASQGLSDTEKSNARANIGGGTYSKPSGGIPKSDLASAVQTSLGKADSALQSETDPTVPAWAKAASKPSYTASEVGLGNVGNFKAVSTVASQGLSDTEKSNARANIGAGTGNGTYSKPSGGIPKTDLASAVQTSLGKADSALQSHQTIKQDGVTGATVNRFGTCSTAAATAAKTVSITSGTFNLEAGARVSVKFTNANTADTPTLNVNSKGAKNIFSKGSQITTGSNKSLLAGTVDFIYDGTQWHLIGNYIDTNTTYSSKSAASGGTDVSLCTTGEKYSWNNKGTYSKPSGGIPKTDLASAVQTSLGKADSALQSETDPTVPAWAKASSKPSYTASEVGLGNVGNFKAVSTVASQGLSDTEKANARTNIGAGTGNGTYSKPSGGIPKTDLASAVQTSLGKADTALQSFTESDPTVPSWAKQSSKPTYTASEVGAIATSAKGAVNGVASLDSSGKVPSSQLSSPPSECTKFSTCMGSMVTTENEEGGYIMYGPIVFIDARIKIPSGEGDVYLFYEAQDMTKSYIEGLAPLPPIPFAEGPNYVRSLPVYDARGNIRSDCRLNVYMMIRTGTDPRYYFRASVNFDTTPTSDTNVLIRLNYIGKKPW